MYDTNPFIQFLRAKIIVLSDVIVNVSSQDINGNCHEKQKCKGKEVFFLHSTPSGKYCFQVICEMFTA